MENRNSNSVDGLNQLIKIANDGKYGYENASKDVEDITLKELFSQYSAERASMVEELKKEVEKLGGEPEKGGDAAGALHRTWMDVRSTFTAGDRAAILNICNTGEEAAVKAYNAEIEKEIFSDNVRELLIKQRSSIQQALNNVRLLEESVTTT